MELLYDRRDDSYHERVCSRLLYWLDDLGAVSLDKAAADAEGFLFAGARPIADYRHLVASRPRVRDRAEEREPLLRLDTVLAALEQAGVRVPTPRTRVLPVDVPLPADLTFPLFLRTAETSWKTGGRISRVASAAALEAEAAELRRAFGWDATLLARAWLDLAPAGEGRYGPIPQEVRVWIVDQVPVAWSFHYLNVLATPDGFPPSAEDLATLVRYGQAVGGAFRSRLVAADFARGVDGAWWFIEAGPGSCAATAHEAVFKAVAGRLRGDHRGLAADRTGGPL